MYKFSERQEKPKYSTPCSSDILMFDTRVSKTVCVCSGMYLWLVVTSWIMHPRFKDAKAEQSIIWTMHEITMALLMTLLLLRSTIDLGSLCFRISVYIFRLANRKPSSSSPGRVYLHRKMRKKFGRSPLVSRDEKRDILLWTLFSRSIQALIYHALFLID
jgi:hypothetical protein